MAAQPRADPLQAARELVAAAEDDGLDLRLIGGLAVRLRAGTVHPVLEREFKDIDVVARPRDAGRAAALLERVGYAGEARFNTLNAGRRGLYVDRASGRELDLFLGDFEMCHTIPLMDRLTVDPQTVPLAELLLTKLQVVELNERDELDLLAMLLAHDVGEHDGETINAGRVAELCAADWGLWRTVGINLDRIAERGGGDGFDAAERECLRARVRALRERIDAQPKSRRWKLRDRIGDRKRWYELPEETR